MRRHKGNTFLRSENSKSEAWRPETWRTNSWRQLEAAGQRDGDMMKTRTQQRNMSKKQAWPLGILLPGWGEQPSSAGGPWGYPTLRGATGPALPDRTHHLAHSSYLWAGEVCDRKRGQQICSRNGHQTQLRASHLVLDNFFLQW